MFFEPVKFILKGSPIPHAKAPANPLNTGHHPENWKDVSMFWFSVPCIRSHKSAGQSFVNFVMGLMVGDRRFPGATILGSEVLYFFRQPSLVSPADWFRTS